MKSIAVKLKRNKAMFHEFKIWNGDYRHIAVSAVLSNTGPYTLLKKYSGRIGISFI